MKILAKSVALAAIAMSVTGVAEARIQAMSDATADGSELLLNVVNYTAKNSYTLDLGVTIAQFMANPNQTLSFALNDGNFQSFAAAYTQGDNVTWGVSGGHQKLEVEDDLPIWGFFTTSIDANPAVFDSNVADVNNTQDKWNGLVSFIQTQDSNSVNQSTFRVEGESGYTAPYGNDFQTALPFIAQGELGTSLAFVQEMLDMNIGDFDTTAVRVFGNQWTLALNGNQGSLVYGPVSQVPVPGAVWMFGSGLLALAGAKRRKAVAA